MSLTLTDEEYVALRGLAFSALSEPDKVRQLATFTRAIEDREGYKLYSLLVRWQELDAPLPPTANFPEVWPPLWEARLDVLNRPVALADVTAMLKEKAKHPEGVMVTRDLGGLVGWTKSEDHFR